MAMAMLLLELAELAEEEEEISRLRVTRRRLRDEQNVFNLPDTQFEQLFKISKDLASNLVRELKPHLQRERPTGLSVETQVLCAIRFYAVGSYQRAIGQDFGLALSQSAVSRCVRSVTLAINNYMFRRWIKFPATPEAREAAKRKFANAEQPFPGAIGTIDCTHIAIVTPKQHEEAFMNHHGYHSMNVQIICDPDLRILNVCARFPGSCDNADIWIQSPVRRHMELCYNKGERQTWLLGDSGYPLEPWLMTPIPNALNGSPKFIYTTAHCSARSVIKRCFGRLKSVWRCLSRQRVLMYEPEIAGRIINACAMLHNMRLHYRVPIEDIVEDDFANVDTEPIPGSYDDELLEERVPLAEGHCIQQQLIKDHFMHL